MHHSDLLIPAAADILAAARDYRDSAERLGDAAGIRQIDRLIVSVVRGACFSWSAGVLTVCSPSGGCYDVRRSGCTCENARHGRSACWHVVAMNILEDMLLERAAEADDDAGEVEPSQHIAQQARAAYDRASARYPNRPLFADRDAETYRRQALAEDRANLLEQRAAREARRQAIEDEQAAIEARQEAEELSPPPPAPTGARALGQRLAAARATYL